MGSIRVPQIVVSGVIVVALTALDKDLGNVPNVL